MALEHPRAFTFMSSRFDVPLDPETIGALLPSCSEDEWREGRERTAAWATRLEPLPNGWLEHRQSAELLQTFPILDGQRLYQHRDGRRVIVTVGPHDGQWWLHVSVSRDKRIPSYEDLADVKRVFVGDELQALQVFPRRAQHVNIHPHCLHLWARLDAPDGLPEFGRHGTI